MGRWVRPGLSSSISDRAAERLSDIESEWYDDFPEGPCSSDHWVQKLDGSRYDGAGDPHAPF